MMKRKHLSTIANDVLQKCSQILDISVDGLVEDFEAGWKAEGHGYSRKLVEFCSSKALSNICCNIEDKIADGSFSRITFDMMLAWERPSLEDEESYSESVAKQKEENNIPPKGREEHDDIPLFYSDIMPLLVSEDPSIGEDAFVWMGSLAPLPADIVNGQFTFEALTATTANRLHFPAYDRYIKEIDKCIKYLQKQATPTGMEFADDEFVLHMEGTAGSQRVVRHIGGTSWPGRLILTNYALYFEASGVISYEDAIKIDLSKNADHSVQPSSTGPWGAPIFDKAIIYESSQLSEAVVLEFPEMTSSTRRDHWLALIKEVILLHQFLLKFKVESTIQAWEMHARTILGIVRLHAAREMLRIFPPVPTNFLIFALFEELPKGDYVLEEVANGLKQVSSINPCSAGSILCSLNMSHPSMSNIRVNEEIEESIAGGQADNLLSLETKINKVREEAKEVGIAKATVDGLKEEGISDNILVLMELISPFKTVLPWCQRVISWEKPSFTVFVLSMTVIIIYKEWIGKMLAVFLVWAVGKILKARHDRTGEKFTEVIVSNSSDQTTVESIVSAQHQLLSVYSMLQTANITILKIQSILLSKAPKHTDQVMVVMIGLAMLLAVIPFKFVIIATTLYYFVMSSEIGKYMENEHSNRRMREWWNSVPIVPVRVVEKTP
ncbi:PREDICTED: uncharacterized protein LOC104587722 isoform X2 [Nelumbo nucifera]|uniref:Uncharacterized protein LOC104587722 isoform X2 n=1 Tax=Nelumbo nucifera TaxID=4432 RepID=A0A1U7Z7Z2_NELNU|nr:PREDICTED: uncharacterized protein LOC104587722 isoform X2 [Nelumbo nucifera]